MKEDVFLRAKNLSARRGKYKAVEGVNFSLSRGELLTILGPNGGGKTTLIKALLGLVKDVEGEIIIDGKPRERVSPSIIGYVPQIKTMDRNFPALAIELIVSGLRGSWPAFVKKSEKEKALEAAKIAGALDFVYKPLRYLSGGQAQRAYLARSFVRKPKLLLLDEPCSGVDQTGEKDLHRIIDRFREEYGATVVVVTHDWEAAYHHSDLVLLLNKKQICCAPPDEAFSSDNLRKAFSHIGHSHKMIFGVGENVRGS